MQIASAPGFAGALRTVRLGTQGNPTAKPGADIEIQKTAVAPATGLLRFNLCSPNVSFRVLM